VPRSLLHKHKNRFRRKAIFVFMQVRGRAFGSRSVLLPARIAPPAQSAEGSALVSNRSFNNASIPHAK